jgi:hypothetical protein
MSYIRGLQYEGNILAKSLPNDWECHDMWRDIKICHSCYISILWSSALWCCTVFPWVAPTIGGMHWHIHMWIDVTGFFLLPRGLPFLKETDFYTNGVCGKWGLVEIRGRFKKLNFKHCLFLRCHSNYVITLNMFYKNSHKSEHCTWHQISLLAKPVENGKSLMVIVCCNVWFGRDVEENVQSSLFEWSVPVFGMGGLC